MQPSPQQGFFKSLFRAFITPAVAPIIRKEHYKASYASYCITDARQELQPYEERLKAQGLLTQLADCHEKLDKFAFRVEQDKYLEDFPKYFDEKSFEKLIYTVIPELINEVRDYEKPDARGMDVINHVQKQGINPLTQPAEWRKTAETYVSDALAARLKKHLENKPETSREAPRTRAGAMAETVLAISWEACYVAPERIGYVAHTTATNAHGYLRQQLRNGQPL